MYKLTTVYDMVGRQYYLFTENKKMRSWNEMNKINQLLMLDRTEFCFQSVWAFGNPRRQLTFNSNICRGIKQPAQILRRK